MDRHEGSMDDSGGFEMRYVTGRPPEAWGWDPDAKKVYGVAVDEHGVPCRIATFSGPFKGRADAVRGYNGATPGLMDVTGLGCPLFETVDHAMIQPLWMTAIVRRKLRYGMGSDGPQGVKIPETHFEAFLLAVEAWRRSDQIRHAARRQQAAVEFDLQGRSAVA